MCSMVLFGPQAVSSHNSSLFQFEALLWVMSHLESYPLNALGNVKYVFFCNIWLVLECRKPSGLSEHFWWISQGLQGLATYTGQVGVSESFCPICFRWNVKYVFFFLPAIRSEETGNSPVLFCWQNSCLLQAYIQTTLLVVFLVPPLNHCGSRYHDLASHLYFTFLWYVWLLYVLSLWPYHVWIQLSLWIQVSWPCFPFLFCLSMMLCGACGSIIFQCSSHVHLFLNGSAFAGKTAIWNRSPNRLYHHNSHRWCRHALYDSLNWSRFAGF